MTLTSTFLWPTLLLRSLSEESSEEWDEKTDESGTEFDLVGEEVEEVVVLVEQLIPHPFEFSSCASRFPPSSVAAAKMETCSKSFLFDSETEYRENNIFFDRRFDSAIMVIENLIWGQAQFSVSVRGRVLAIKGG